MAAWQNFLDNFSGQAEFQAQKQGEQLQAEIDYYNSPEGQRAAQIGGGIMAAMLPIPGSKLLGAGRAAKPVIDKMYGAVGKDMVGRAPLPVSKAPVQTARGPRGPINIETPAVTPKAPPPGTRNTGGLSETDKAMIDFIKPTAIGNRRNRPIKDEWLISKSNRNRAKEVDKVKWNKDQIPNKSDRILQRRPANAEEVEIIKDLTKKGFYDKSGSKGIMNTPPARSQMEQVGAAKRTEQLANRQKFLEDAIRLNRSKIAANEAPSKDYNRLLEEYSRLIESLK